MNITIHTNQPIFGYRLAEFLEADGHVASVHGCEPGPAELRHRPDMDAKAVRNFLQSLKPLDLRPVLDDALGGDFQIRLCVKENLAEIPLELAAETPQMLDYLAQDVAGSFGLPVKERNLSVAAEGKLAFRDVPPLARQMLRWWLLQDGHVVVEEDESDVREFSFDDAPASKAKSELGIMLKAQSLGDRALRELTAVDLKLDDPDDLIRLSVLLEAQGFRVGKQELLDEQEAAEAVVQVHTAWLGRAQVLPELEGLLTLVRAFAVESGVNPEYYPLQQKEGEALVYNIELLLPLKACRERRRPAYAGSLPERFNLSLYVDGECDSLHARLKEAGFRSIDIREFDVDDLVKGFRLRLMGGKDAPQVVTLLKDLVQQEMAEIGAAAEFKLGCDDMSLLDSPKFEVYFPAHAFADGSLGEARFSPKFFDLKVHCPDRRPWQEPLVELEGWGFGEFEVTHERHSPAIHYGGAPRELLDRIVKLFDASYGLTLKTVKKWGESDNDIWVFLPERVAHAAAAPSAPGRPGKNLNGWLNGAAAGSHTNGCHAKGSFLDSHGSMLAVGDLLLEKVSGPPHALVPRPEEFGHFCVDAKTAELLHHIATCILLDEPCLLEGETSTSKTSSIRFLAMHLNQPMVRLNLHGQTDAGDLIGRYVPAGQEPGCGTENADRIHRESKQFETHASGWRWQHGMLVQAMLNGWGLILDEVNNWDANLLEGLNSVLERGRSLVLKEYDNSLIGPGGVPVHPRFRIFATMNPAEYSGRVRLSPAFKDRWVGYRFVEPPGETEYLGMLRLLVHGVHPPVSCGGMDFSGMPAQALHPQLAGIAGIDRVLESLARLHVALERAAKPGAGRASLGQESREGIVVTRRSLLGVVSYMANPMVSGGTPACGRLRHAISRYYLGRARSADDRAAMLQILDSVGLGPNTWAV